MAGAGNNIYGQAAQGLQGAAAGTAASGMGPNIGAFMNPYTSAVTNQTLADLERQRQMAISTGQAQAQAAGAYGGSRHGIADAATTEGFARTGAQTLANLNLQGFNTALGAAQNQQQIGLQAANQMANLANLGFGWGQQVQAQQAQQGAQQQALQQALIDQAKAQYSGYTQAPMQALQTNMAALGAANMGQQSQTTTKKPGLYDYLSLGATMYGGA